VESGYKVRTEVTFQKLSAFTEPSCSFLTVSYAGVKVLFACYFVRLRFFDKNTENMSGGEDVTEVCHRLNLSSMWK